MGTMNVNAKRSLAKNVAIVDSQISLLVWAFSASSETWMPRASENASAIAIVKIPPMITNLDPEKEWSPTINPNVVIIASKPQPPPSYDRGEWVQIVAFNGSKSNTTEVFHVPHGTFRTHYSYSGGQWARFLYYVYPEDGEEGHRIRPSGSKTSGSHIHDGPGTFYIKTIAGAVEEWTITVEAFIPYD